MSLINQMNEWSSKHNPKWLVVIRIVLGLSLFIKGFGFIQNSVLLPGVIAQVPFIQNAPWLASVIPWAHILGGTMIIIGLFTRLSCLVQIPILLGAVFLVNLRLGLVTGGSDLLFSVIVLVLLVIFFIEGGGKISLDNYFFADLNKEGKGQSA